MAICVIDLSLASRFLFCLAASMQLCIWVSRNHECSAENIEIVREAVWDPSSTRSAYDLPVVKKIMENITAVYGADRILYYTAVAKPIHGFSSALVTVRVTLKDLAIGNTSEEPYSRELPEFIDILDYSVHALFNTMQAKNMPIYQCNRGGGALFKIPPPIVCKTVSPELKSKSATISIWYPDPTDQQIPAYKCFGVDRDDTKKAFMGTTKEWIFRENQFAVTESECRKMVDENICPAGNELKRNKGTGVFGTSNYVATDWPWWGTNSITAKDYYYTPIKLSVDNHDRHILSLELLKETCHYSKGSCKVDKGILIWDKAEVTEKCRLVKTLTSACILTGREGNETVMSCPDMKMMMTKLRTFTMCNLELGYSEQGVLFTQEETGAVANNVVITSVLDAVVVGGMNNAKRNRRESGVTEYRKTMGINYASRSNAELQFIHAIIMSNVTFAASALHADICRAAATQLEALRALSEAGHTDVLVRALLRNKKYRGVQVGDMVSVTVCNEIFSYRLLDQNEDTCTWEWPLEYFDSTLGITKKGYLRPSSHEIVEKGTDVDCNSMPPFILEMGNISIDLGNRSIVMKPQVLPIPLESDPSMFKIPDISWTNPGSVLSRHLGGRETLNDMMVVAAQQRRMESTIFKASHGLELTKVEEGFLNSMIDALTSPYKLFLGIGKATITVIVIICAVILSIYIFTFFKCHRLCVVGTVSLPASNLTLLYNKQAPYIQFKTVLYRTNDYDDREVTADERGNSRNDTDLIQNQPSLSRI